MDLNGWYKKATAACARHDSDTAYFVLRKWGDIIKMVSKEETPTFEKIKKKLLYTAFPSLPTKPAADIIAQGVLDFVMSEVDIDEVVSNRFLYIGYGEQEDDRRIIREAFLNNKQILGSQTIGDWLRAFEKSLSSDAGNDTSVGKYFGRDTKIASLNKAEQVILHKVLNIYNQWYVSPVVSQYDMVAIYNKLEELEKAGVKEINPNTFVREHFPSSRMLQGNAVDNDTMSGQTNPYLQTLSLLPLLDALSKYPNLSNQIVTSERIKIKSQSQSVRPSVVNWIKAYRDAVGVGHHDSVQRGQFIFSSENGKRLPAEERDRLNTLLRSLDENIPLDIDTERNEIIFLPKAPTTSSSGQKPPLAFASGTKNDPFAVGGARVGTGNEGGMSFSSKHILPAEKDAAQQPSVTAQYPSGRPTVEPPKPHHDPKPNPFYIRPVSGEVKRGATYKE